MTTIWLIDKSAIGRLHLTVDAAAWAARIERGLVRISTVTRLEIGFSARSGVRPWSAPSWARSPP